jgi:hypothetical protein
MKLSYYKRENGLNLLPNSFIFKGELYRGAIGIEGHVERLIYPPSRVPLLQETTKVTKPACSAAKIRERSVFVKRNGMIGVLVQVCIFASSAGCARAQQCCA